MECHHGVPSPLGVVPLVVALPEATDPSTNLILVRLQIETFWKARDGMQEGRDDTAGMGCACNYAGAVIASPVPSPSTMLP